MRRNVTTDKTMATSWVMYVLLARDPGFVEPGQARLATGGSATYHLH
jgi:hypothetical protein